ncbi:MAG TPA: LptE family protein [Kiritimatiellia bacterium]|jgi:outer membrane lipopolysaccharide assembly protein LptE/RlpB
MRSKLLLPIVLALASAATFSGCAGYHLGSMLPPDVASVYVPTFVNKTKEPLLEVDTTGATIEELQKDGSLKVADADTADAILEVTITEFDLSPVSFRREEETAAREYRMTISVAYVLRRRSDGSIVTESQRVSGDATFALIGNMSSSKLSGIPNASADLAHKIVEQLVETWQ